MSRGLNSRPNAGEDERITIDTTDLEGALLDSEEMPNKETNKYAEAPEATSPTLEREAEGRKKPEEKNQG